MDYPSAWGDCTTDEMYLAAGGNLVSAHTPVSPSALIRMHQIGKFCTGLVQTGSE